ncbi:MAG: hypothetical protein ACKO5F_06015, partial [Synechococcus sp.]
MLHWYSTFPLPERVLAQLDQAGLHRLQEPPREGEEPVLLLYDTPDRLLEGTELDASNLLQGYRALLAAPVSSPRLALWRLHGVDTFHPDLLRDVLSGTTPSEGTEPARPPKPNALTALVTTAICRNLPGLLDAYLDLELQAQLLGGEPDVAYLRRLQGENMANELLSAWRTPAELTLELQGLREQLQEKESALSEAREEVELTLLQLHQVQEEREQIFLADREKQQQLEGKWKEVSELQCQLSEKEAALADAREEAELTLLQLHQVQEEREQIFLADREKQQQLEGKWKEVSELQCQLSEKEA